GNLQQSRKAKGERRKRGHACGVIFSDPLRRRDLTFALRLSTLLLPCYLFSGVLVSLNVSLCPSRTMPKVSVVSVRRGPPCQLFVMRCSLIVSMMSPVCTPARAAALCGRTARTSRPRRVSELCSACGQVLIAST